MSNGIVDIDCFALGAFGTNCFIVRPAGAAACWIVDPPETVAPLMSRVEAGGFTVDRILLTHGHIDHIGGVAAVKQAYPDATITAPTGDAAMLTDAMANLSALFGPPLTAPEAEECVDPGDTLQMGELTWRVLDTAGHTPGGVSFYCPEAAVVIAGDALFAGSIGRTDFPGGDHDQLIANIRDHLLTLPDDTRVLCGHGPDTMIGREKKTNPYVG